ncbi:hypothetical protein [uncultured Bradyrhizobium sp.]|uniref:hypothetical protein n=1 Tax=Bradyrhizobium sp. TaxID=376 RepID=UPI00260B9879|nr:hypothetical protein [uncultured Bradyrhizobium sp.]
MTGRGDQPTAMVHGIRLPSVAGTDLRSHVITNRTLYPKSKFRLQTSRTSFAPETTRTKRGECGRILQKRKKINGGGHYPAAHNGLVAGSSPAPHIGKSPALDF